MAISISTILALGYDALLTEPITNIKGRVVRPPQLKASGQIIRMMPNGRKLVIRGYENGTVSTMDMSDYNLSVYKTDTGFLKKLESYDLQQATTLLRASRINKILKDL